MQAARSFCSSSCSEIIGSVKVGGAVAPLKALFTGLPPAAFATGAETAGVSAAALGAGYFAFFLYSTVIGVVGIVLAFVVARMSRSLESVGGA